MYCGLGRFLLYIRRKINILTTGQKINPTNNCTLKWNVHPLLILTYVLVNIISIDFHININVYQYKYKYI